VKAIKIHPCLVAYNNPEEGLVVMVDNNQFETPGIWGIVVADIIQHIVNAYTADGMAGPAVRTELIHYLLSELEKPTAKAHRVDAEWEDEGFSINRDDADDDEDDLDEGEE
jgi:hypothetical protein